IDYSADGGDDGDDEDESSNNDEDDDVDIEEDEEAEEHPTPTDSTVVALPAVDHALSAEETGPFETDESAATLLPHPAYRVTARISIRDEPPTPFWLDTEIPSPPLSVSPPPASPTYPLGYRATMIRLRAEAPSTSHSPPPHITLSHTRADTPPSGTPPLLPIPLPTSSPPLHLLSTDRRAVRLKVTLLLRKRLGIALGLRYEVGESSSAPTARPPGGAPATDETELGRRMTNFVTNVRHDTYEIYVRLDDKQTKRQLMAGRLNMLYRDRRAVITELQAADYRRQAAIIELLAADRKRQAQFIEALKRLKILQTQMIEFERQQGPAKGPAQPDAPEEAGSSS
ncbi:hypothetical protein Tco_1158376, partial [Tanacetum coccineum]